MKHDHLKKRDGRWKGVGRKRLKIYDGKIKHYDFKRKTPYSKINAIPTVSTRKHKNTAGRSDKSLSNNYLRESFTKKTGSKRRKKKKITTSNQQTAQPLLQLKKPSSSRKNVYTSFVSVSKSQEPGAKQ